MVAIVFGGLGNSDFHMHSRFSLDGRGGPADLAAVARQKGLTAIGLSEHADFDPDDHGYRFLDLDAYQRAVEAVDVTDLRVLCGVEVDYQQRFEPEIRGFLDDFGGDYVIGSVHFVDGIPLYGETTFRTRDLAALYASYRDAHLDMLATGWFDVVGHLDFPKRYGTQYIEPWPSELLNPFLDDVLRALVGSDTLLEINTGGLRKLLRETSPSLHLARRFVDLGGRRVIVGSDAHTPGDVGFAVRRVTAELRRMGLDVVEPSRR